MTEINSTVHSLDSVQPALSSTKVRKKRGRPGDKIATAFKNIPTQPVDAETFATTHGITAKTLRQVKRHDKYSETGKVFVRKNRETKRVMVWRVPADR